MRIDAISIGINPPHDVNVIIEVPVGGEPIKYEMDKEAGTMVVDRYLYTAMRYPGNYGFIPHTLSKIIAVPSSKLTQRYDKVRNYNDLPDITLQQIQHFFEHYKDLEKGKWVKVLRWGDAEEAHRLIMEGVARAKKK
jgi:inorganic pyrophosphatase